MERATHEEPPSPVKVDSIRSLGWIMRFLAEPLSGATAMREELGQFVSLQTPKTLRAVAHKVPAQVYLGVGAQFNRAILGDPETWRTVNITGGGKKDHVSRQLGRGLVQMNGPGHKHYRKLLTPPLRKNRVDAKGPRLAHTANAEIDQWAKDDVPDIMAAAKSMLQKFTVDLFLGGDRSRGCPVGDMIHTVFGDSFSIKANIPIEIPGTPYEKSLRECERLSDALVDWGWSKKGDLDGDDFLALLANNPDENGDPPTDMTFINHVPTIFGAAYETCLNTFVWSLIALAAHPQIQQDLIDEIRAAIDPEAPDYEKIRDLELLDRVVHEMLRLMPPVPLQYRVATRDTEFFGAPAPRLTRVVLSPFLTNRDPDVFEDADRFNPDRWIGRRRDPYEMTAFSAGPRVCPGSWFGYAMVKTALATLLAKRAVVIQDKTQIDYVVGVTLSPRSPIAARFTDAPAAQAPHYEGQVRRLFKMAA